MEAVADIIVIGLGAMGSSVAQHLAQRGCRVLGFDRYTPPHTYGSSHGLTRIYRQAYFEDSRYVPMLLRAYQLWQQLEQDAGERLLHLTGALVLGAQQGHLVQRSIASAQQFNLPHQVLRASEIKSRYPAFFTTGSTLGVVEQNAGYLLPELCVRAQLSQAARASADLRTDEPVLDWQAHSTGVTVRTASATYSAQHLVITAGPWAPQLLADLSLPLQVTRQVLYWFQPSDDLANYLPDRMPVYVIEAEEGQPLVYGFPLTGLASEGVKVAVHGTPEFCTPETVDRTIRASDEEYIRARLATTLPGLAGTLLRAETCLYTMTPDEHFILDAHPDQANVTLAAGFSGHGFKFASVIGEMIADLVTRGRTNYDHSLFSLDRFAAASNPAPLPARP